MKRKTDAVVVLPILVPVLGMELSLAIIEFRDIIKREPLTEYAAKLQAKEYLKTGDPVAAAEMQILRSWRAIKSDWFLSETKKQSPYQKPESTFAKHQRECRETLERSIHGSAYHAQFDNGQSFDLDPADFRTH